MRGKDGKKVPIKRTQRRTKNLKRNLETYIFRLAKQYDVHSVSTKSMQTMNSMAFHFHRKLMTQVNDLNSSKRTGQISVDNIERAARLALPKSICWFAINDGRKRVERFLRERKRDKKKTTEKKK